MRKPNLLLLAGLGLVLHACSSTSRLTMNILEPARIVVAPDIQRIGIINRSVPDEKHKTTDRIDQVLSLEGFRLDKEGAGFATTGLADELSGDHRFEMAAVIDPARNAPAGMATFPAPLRWDVVSDICREFSVDALISLEYFDTDTRAAYQMTTMRVPNNLGIKVTVPAHAVTLQTLIKATWRVYDPKRKMILDDYTAYREINSHGEGLNPLKAIEAVTGRNDAVFLESGHIGKSYAFRTRSAQKRIARDYYVRGTENLKTAKRRAETGDWEGAARLWQADLGHPKPKIAGRACYNMAIINEINGELGAAMDWAAKSYSDYRDKNALRYLDILKYRAGEDEELEAQSGR